MRIKAERAMDKADEFIREKQRKSAIAMAAERAMQDKGPGLMPRTSSMESGASDGGGWKMNNAMPNSPASPTDETYQAAKAAAGEAKKLATNHASHSKGKASLFSNIFHRGKHGGGGSKLSKHGIPSHSSHGGVVSPAPVSGMGFKRGGSNGSAGIPSPLPPTQESPKKMEISSYGSPRSLNEDMASDSAVEEDKRREIELEHERQSRLEMERQQREAAEVQAEINRRKQEREELQKKEEEERLRKQEEERLRRQSPKVKMQSILDHLADATRTSTDNVTQLREKRAKMVKERAQAEKAERYADQQLKFAEAQQTIAAEEEDFESADRLAGVIEKHSREKEVHSDICKKINDSMTKLDEEKEAASKAVSACFASVHTKLQQLESEVDDRSKETDVLDQFATTSKRLSSETERLSNDLKHIERDEKVWKEESDELGGQIEEKTKEFDEKCAEASTKLEEVNKTIEDLRKQLSEAESKASNLDSEISSYKRSINHVRSKYTRQLGRLEKKEHSVKESRADWESEKVSIEKAKAAHEAVVAAHSEDMLSRENLIDAIKSESSAAKDFEDIVSGAFADTNGEGEGQVSDPDGEVLKYEAVVNEAERNVVAAEANIQSLQEELTTIEVRVPILEVEKKAAASKRDFKAAGKASKEIKDALARKERCAAELSGEAMERKQFTKDELQKISALLEEKKSIAAEKGKEAGMKQMDLLRGKIDELKSMLKKFATTDSEKFATENWEEGEDAITVSCVGAFVIESQICVLEGEGKLLGEKYGGWACDDVVEDSSVQSAPTFDSADGDENDSEIVIDKVVLAKYINMRSEMKNLEGAIELAAEDEDFDKAAELEDQAQSVREEFEAAGFLSEKFDRALKEFTEKTSSGAATAAADNAENNDDSSEKVIDESVLEKYASLCANIKEFEASIETAVANEDFDTAAELEEKIQLASSDIESLGFSIDDLEEALKNRPETEDAAEEEQEEEGDASSDDGGSDNKEECTVEINDDDEKKAPDDDDDAVKMNGESAQEEEEDAVDNTDGADEDG